MLSVIFNLMDSRFMDLPFWSLSCNGSIHSNGEYGHNLNGNPRLSKMEKVNQQKDCSHQFLFPDCGRTMMWMLP